MVQCCYVRPTAHSGSGGRPPSPARRKDRAGEFRGPLRPVRRPISPAAVGGRLLEDTVNRTTPTALPGALPQVLHLPGRGRTVVWDAPGPAGAPTLFLVHGVTLTAALNWGGIVETLRRRYRVVLVDQRGHGAGLPCGAFRLEDCADDLAAIAEELGIERVIAVGYSMGGPIAQLLWRRHPDLVAGLVLCATSASFVGTMRERMLVSVATGTSALASTVPLGRMTSAALGKWTGWRDRRGPSWWGFEEVARHDWAQIVEAGRETLRFDSRRWIGDLDVPAAVLVNDDDRVVPTARQRDLAARIAQARTWTVHGGHA